MIRIGRLDLMSMDFFLWGFLKSKVYLDKLTIIHALKKEIELLTKFSHIYAYKTIMENFNKKVRMYQQSHGGHLLNILYYILWINISNISINQKYYIIFYESIKKFTIFNYKPMFSIKIISCMNFGILFIHIHIYTYTHIHKDLS